MFLLRFVFTATLLLSSHVWADSPACEDLFTPFSDGTTWSHVRGQETSLLSLSQRADVLALDPIVRELDTRPVRYGRVILATDPIWKSFSEKFNSASPDRKMMILLDILRVSWDEKKPLSRFEAWLKWVEVKQASQHRWLDAVIQFHGHMFVIRGNPIKTSPELTLRSDHLQLRLVREAGNYKDALPGYRPDGTLGFFNFTAQTKYRISKIPFRSSRFRIFKFSLPDESASAEVSEAVLNRQGFAMVNLGPFRFSVIKETRQIQTPHRLESMREKESRFRIVDHYTKETVEIPESFYRSKL